MVEKHQWHSMTARSDADNNFIEADAMVSGDSDWFDGHFPGQPILPGIAFIAMAFELACKQEARQGNCIRLKAVKRVRFKKPVCPDEPFTIEVKREQKESGITYRFAIMLSGEAGCTGILAVEMIS